MIAEAIVAECESGEREYAGGLDACRRDAPCRGEVWWAYLKSEGETAEGVAAAVEDWSAYTEAIPASTQVWNPILDQRSDCGFGAEFLGEEAVERLDDWIKVTGTIDVDRACDDLGGFSDIMRLEIVVFDGEGNYLAKMEPNPLNGIPLIESSLITSCLASFSAEDVPKASVYKVDAGRRGTFWYEEDELTPDLFGGVVLFEWGIG